MGYKHRTKEERELQHKIIALQTKICEAKKRIVRLELDECALRTRLGLVKEINKLIIYSGRERRKKKVVLVE